MKIGCVLLYKPDKAWQLLYELGRPRDGKISPPPLSKPIAAE